MSEKVVYAILNRGEHWTPFRKHTSGSKYGCSTSSSTANSCESESPKINIYGTNIKYHHARRGREAVFEQQFGDDKKSYTDLVSYVKAIEETNPDSYENF
ncbi:hypothetical protein C5167_004496 [Papaver somniferum]|uniref:Uncharacterized protein n=1 Tax=Papaver somniferum TaxID=3469 RepID=A0A4Y7JC29_PAPSO|nr:hypothetical protein C5167_004496 [Papaver somniferum]